MRATAVALLLFVLNLVGLGFGPPFCGGCIDLFSQTAFAAGNAGDFFALCPGGVGAATGSDYEWQSSRISS